MDRSNGWIEQGTLPIEDFSVTKCSAHYYVKEFALRSEFVQTFGVALAPAGGPTIVRAVLPVFTNLLLLNAINFLTGRDNDQPHFQTPQLESDLKYT